MCTVVKCVFGCSVLERECDAVYYHRDLFCLPGAVSFYSLTFNEKFQLVESS